MPSGKVHDKLTVVTAAAGAAAYLAFVPRHDFVGAALGVGAYLFSGFYLSDDLDTKSVSYKRWGPFRWLWLPYQRMVPHRSWVSHGLVVGPIVRVAYFLVVTWGLARMILWGVDRLGAAVNRDAVINGAWQASFTWMLAHPAWTWWTVAGLVAGGVTHSVADAIVSGVKRRW